MKTIFCNTFVKVDLATGEKKLSTTGFYRSAKGKLCFFSDRELMCGALDPCVFMTGEFRYNGSRFVALENLYYEHKHKTPSSLPDFVSNFETELLKLTGGVEKVRFVKAPEIKDFTLKTVNQKTLINHSGFEHLFTIDQYAKIKSLETCRQEFVDSMLSYNLNILTLS